MRIRRVVEISAVGLCFSLTLFIPYLHAEMPGATNEQTRSDYKVSPEAAEQVDRYLNSLIEQKNDGEKNPSQNNGSTSPSPSAVLVGADLQEEEESDPKSGSLLKPKGGGGASSFDDDVLIIKGPILDLDFDGGA